MASLTTAKRLSLPLYFFTFAAAIPRIAFPLNSQVPPVARIGQPYSFTFSAATFAGDARSLDYSLQNPPVWLNIDASTRTLYGTPGSADVGFPAFSIVAFDTAGRTSMPSTLVVVASDHEPPTAEVDVVATLAQGGRLSAPRTLLVMPRTSFAFSFAGNAFKSSSGPLTFYATLEDHTPLPSWLIFDDKNLRLSGIAPVLSASPQYLNILLIATDIPGFAAASVSFTIVISVHSFYFAQVKSSTVVEPGASFEVANIRDSLVLDGQPAKPDDISRSAVEGAAWLKFDQKAMTLHGKAPLDLEDGTVSVQVWNRFGDIANKTFLLQVSSGLLSTNFPIVEARAGLDFKYTLADSLFTVPNLDVSVGLRDAIGWLRYDFATRTLSGKPPDDATSPIVIEVIAKLANGSRTDKRRLEIDVQPLTSTSTNTTTAGSNPSTSATGEVLAAAGKQEGTNISRTVGMVIGIVMAIVGVLCFFVFLVWHRRFGRQNSNDPRSQMKKTISRPRFDGHDPWSAGIDEGDVEKGTGILTRAGHHPPQVHLKIPNISPFKKLHQSHTPLSTTIKPVPPTIMASQGMMRQSHLRGQSLASSTIHGDDVKILDNINRSSWGYSGTRRPHDSMKLPTEMARQSRLLSGMATVMTPDNSTSARRASSTRLSLGPVSGQSSSRPRTRVASGGLPVRPRPAGLSHGRSSSSRHSVGNLLQLRQQNRTPSYADSVTTDATSVLFSSPRTPAPVPRPCIQSSPLHTRCSATQNYDMLSIQRPIPRRGPHRPGFFSARSHSRGSSSSRHRGTILGLSTIHASPDLETNAIIGATETPNGLGIAQSIEIPQPSMSITRNSYHPLRRNPTEASEKSTTTWQSYETGMDASQVLESAPPVPERHPAHKRWSSQLKARLTRPLSGVLSESSRFADTEEPSAIEGASVVPEAPLIDDDASVYSQSSVSASAYHSATPSPERERPPTRGKIPIGGVRVPPFTDAVKDSADSIMNRPHPRVSIRKASRETSLTPQQRLPLARVPGAENRLSSGGGHCLNTITARPVRLKSGKGGRPVSVIGGAGDKIRTVKGSVVSGRTAGSNKSGRALSMSPITRGNECFL